MKAQSFLLNEKHLVTDKKFFISFLARFDGIFMKKFKMKNFVENLVKRVKVNEINEKIGNLKL
jgi:hypothetical protein